ncbi:MAG: hypothetical protein JRJ87_20950 [Deltaproteobacteria bacterium]|nr:hypothetical protein [Deltaproteobacteria bacterium]
MSRLPEHIVRFKCMEPYKGPHYRDPDHKRVLIVGESHYLPASATIHEDPEDWYASDQSALTDDERDWVSTGPIIASSMKERFRFPGHSIYKNVAQVLNMNGLGLENNDFAIEHLAFYNYFQRPAHKGQSLDISDTDIRVAEEVLDWVVSTLDPDLVAVVSSKANGYAKRHLKNLGVPFESTPHPTCSWWNRPMKKREGRSGRELLSRFLVKHRWHNNCVHSIARYSCEG